MLVITIEIIPGGFTPRRRTIGQMRIANLSDLADVSDYAVDVMSAANPLTGAPARSGSFTVAGHHRRQAVWALLARAAANCLDTGVDWVDL